MSLKFVREKKRLRSSITLKCASLNPRVQRISVQDLLYYPKTTQSSTMCTMGTNCTMHTYHNYVLCIPAVLRMHVYHVYQQYHMYHVYIV